MKSKEISELIPPIPLVVIDRIKSILLSSPENLRLKSDSKIIFVCGADPRSRSSGREKLLEYAKKELKHLRFFRAEDIFDELYEHYKTDLLSLENKMAQFADCIILILESDGTYAELGAFAISENLAKIMMIINDIRHQTKSSESFITRGPIAYVDRVSRFKPAIYVKIEGILTEAEEIKKRLKKIETFKSSPTDLTSYKKFLKFLKNEPKAAMLFLADLIYLLAPIKQTELIAVLERIFGGKTYEIQFSLSILKAIKIITKYDNESGSYLVREPEEPSMFYRFVRLNYISLRADVMNHYRRNDGSRLTVLQQKIKAL